MFTRRPKRPRAFLQVPNVELAMIRFRCQWITFVLIALLLSRASVGSAGNDASREKIKLRYVLKGNAGHFVSVGFSADGKILAAGNMDGTVRFWDVASGKSIRKQFVYPEDTSSVFSLAFSPDGNKFASAGTGFSGSLRVWDLATQKELWNREKFLYCNQVLFSPDGKRLAVSGYRTVYVFDSVNGKEVWTASIDPGFFTSLSFSPDGSALLSGGHGFLHARVWDVGTGKLVSKVELNRPDFFGGIYSLTFTGKKTFAVGSHNSVIGIWNVEGKKVGGLLRNLAVEGRVMSLAVPPNEKLLVFGTAKGSFGIFSLNDSKRLTDGISGEADIAVAVSPDGRLVATTGWNFNPGRSFINVWDIGPLDTQGQDSKDK